MRFNSNFGHFYLISTFLLPNFYLISTYKSKSYTYYTYIHTNNTYTWELNSQFLIFHIYVYAKNQKKGHFLSKVSSQKDLEGRKWVEKR